MLQLLTYMGVLLISYRFVYNFVKKKLKVSAIDCKLNLRKVGVNLHLN